MVDSNFWVGGTEMVPEVEENSSGKRTVRVATAMESWTFSRYSWTISIRRVSRRVFCQAALRDLRMALVGGMAPDTTSSRARMERKGGWRL